MESRSEYEWSTPALIATVYALQLVACVFVAAGLGAMAAGAWYLIADARFASTFTRCFLFVGIPLEAACLATVTYEQIVITVRRMRARGCSFGQAYDSRHLDDGDEPTIPASS